MKNNRKDSALKIAKFLGQEFVIKFKENNEFVLNKIIENLTVDVMKSSMNFDILLRKGIVGDAKNILIKLKVI